MVVDKTFNIKIETEFIHPNYNLDLNDQELIGNTGLLKVFELKPTDIERPMFRGRWCRKDDVMDIDIINGLL